MTQEAAQRRDEILAEVARLEDDARVRASAIVASAQQELEAERARLAEERAELRGRELTLREREAQVEDDLAFAQAKESMLAERFERRLEAQVADVREQLEESAADPRAGTPASGRRGIRSCEALRAELARYGEDPESAKRRNDDLVQQLAALRDELSRRPPADEVSELRQLAKAAAEAQAEAAHWRQQHDQVERQLRYQLVSVGELEVLRDERDASASSA